MKKIFAIAFKDLRARFTSWYEWLFFLILPIVFTLILAGGTGGGGDNRVRLVVVDQAGSPLSAELLAALNASDAVRIDVLSLEQANAQFSQRRVSAVLIIPPELDLATLENGSVQIELRQQPNNLNAMVAQRAVMAVIGRVGSAVDIANASVAAAEQIQPFSSAQDRLAYFNAALSAAQTRLSASPDRIKVTTGSTPDQVEYDPRANSSAGQLITWVFIPLIGLSELFAIERQTGTLRRILISPTSKATYLFGTIFGQVVMALLQMSLLMGFGTLVLHLNWGHDLAGLALMMVTSALAASAMGTALGTLVKTPGQANGLSLMLGMVMALLGGCWYPLEMFPQVIQQAVRVLPTTWAMQGLLALVLRGQGLMEVLLPAGVLTGFAAVFFGVGILRFRYE